MREPSKISILATLLVLKVQSSLGHGEDHDHCAKHESRPNATRPTCELLDNGHRLVCSGGIGEKWRTEGANVRTLELCNWPEETFDPQDVLQGFASLRKLVLANGNLSTLTSAFPSEVRLLEKVNVTGTKLRGLPERAFANLTDLRTVDLRNNAISEVNAKTFDGSTVRHIYLAGNPLRCTEDTAWILDSRKGSLARKLSDKDKLHCGPPYDGRPLAPVVEIITTLKEECKRTICDCELVYVVGRMGKHVQKQLMAFVSVNCSYRDLTEMPDFLPANTTTLRLAGNKINDLRPLTTNPAYKGVVDLYLDDNLIESIVQLEGSDWLDHFRLLSLRGNKLTDLPTYALENVLLHSGNAASLYLGNNPWRCDCLFTPGFQDLLIRYTNLVKDINDVKCSPTNGDGHSNKHIRDLTRTEICIPADEDPWIHPLDILNIILASLILLVLGKLVYDYWSFKKTGKLPWIVAKIP